MHPGMLHTYIRTRPNTFLLSVQTVTPELSMCSHATGFEDCPTGRADLKSDMLESFCPAIHVDSNVLPRLRDATLLTRQSPCHALRLPSSR